MGGGGVARPEGVVGRHVMEGEVVESGMGAGAAQDVSSGMLGAGQAQRDDGVTIGVLVVVVAVVCSEVAGERGGDAQSVDSYAHEVCIVES